MNKFFLFLLVLCNFFSIQAIIVEHKNIDAILQYIDTPNTLVVFDLDNTLITSPYEIGTDQWFSYLLTQKQKEGMKFEHALNLILPTYFHVAFKIWLIPVENNALIVLNKLQEMNVPTLGLTSRSIFLADRTLEQLFHIDINLSIPHIQQREIYLLLPSGIPSLYKEGILFSGTNDKGTILLQFFKETNYYPSKVIFVDDKRKYLVAVEAALEQKAIPVIGIRYGGADERVKNFDPEKAERELVQFKAGLLPEPKPASVFTCLCNFIHSVVRCFIPA